MKHFKKLNILVLALALLIPVFFISCASDQEVITKDIAEKKLYDQAQRRLKTNNFVSAILTLETLKRDFLLVNMRNKHKLSLFMPITKA